MKAFIQRALQQILGYDRYLWYFTNYKLQTLRNDKNENDFFHFISLIDPSKTTLDIGANLGLMTYHLAKASTDTVAIEPMPNNYEIIERVIRKYKLNNVLLLKCAVGNQNKEIQLVLPEVDGVKKQGLAHVVDEKMTEFNEGLKFTTNCIRIDDLVELKEKEIGAIKIDVENFEYEVFLGAKETIQKHQPIIYCELWDNQNRLDCFQFFKELNYSASVIVNRELQEVESNPSDIQNFFFLPN